MALPPPTTTHSSPSQAASWAREWKSASSARPGTSSSIVKSRPSVECHTAGPLTRLPVISQPGAAPVTGPTLVAVSPLNRLKGASWSSSPSPSWKNEVTRGLPCAPPERAPTATTRPSEQPTPERTARRPQ